MARFNPEIENQQSGRDYTGASGGTRSSLGALGGALEGLGDAFSGYVKAQDQINRNNLSFESHDEVDNLLNNDVLAPSTGPIMINVAPPQNLSGVGSPEVATEIAAGGAEARRLRQAMDQGKRSDLYVMPRVAAISKRLKAKFPGYRDQVDDAVIGALTSNPANRVRLELEAQHQKELASVDEQTRFKRQWGKENEADLVAIGVDPSEVEFMDPARFAQVRFKVASKKAEDNDIKRDSALIELERSKIGYEKDTLGITSERTIRMFRKKVGQEAKLFFERADQGGVLINSIKQAMANDGKIDPKEKAMILPMLANAKVDLKNRVNLLMTSEGGEGLTDEGREDVTNYALSFLDTYEKAVTDDKLDALKYLVETNKYTAEQDKYHALRGDMGEELQIITRITNMDLAPGTAELALKDTISQDNVVNGLTKYLTSGVITGATDNLGKSLDTLMRKDKVTNPAVYKETINRVSGVLSIPGNKPEDIERVATTVYSLDDDKLLDMFSPNGSREEVFFQLTKSEIIKNVKGTKAYDNLQAWSQNQFPKIAKPVFDRLSANPAMQDYISLKWDSDQDMFVYVQKPVKPNVAGRLLGEDQKNISRAISDIGILNKYNSTMKNIITNGSGNPEEIIRNLYRSIAPEDVLKNQKLGSAVQDLIDGDVSDKAEADGDAQEEKAASARPSRSIISYRNQQATRKRPLTPTLEKKLAQAIPAVLGEGYRAVVYSGGQPLKGGPEDVPGARKGSIRHDEGRAADVFIVGPDGKKVTDRATLDKVRDFWLSEGYGSVGTYMKGMGMHLDEWTQDQLRPDMSLSWNY